MEIESFTDMVPAEQRTQYHITDIWLPELFPDLVNVTEFTDEYTRLLPSYINTDQMNLLCSFLTAFTITTTDYKILSGSFPITIPVQPKASFFTLDGLLTKIAVDIDVQITA